MPIIRIPKNVEKKISEWLADVSRITPTSITSHLHLSKSSHLPYKKNPNFPIFPNSWYQLRVLVGVKRVTIPGRIVRVLLGGCPCRGVLRVRFVCGVHFSVDEFVLRESPLMNW